MSADSCAGVSDFIGGLVPLLPFFFIPVALHALYVSIAVTGLVLLIFGAFKVSGCSHGLPDVKPS